jgi:hypothetical protein
MHTGTQAFAAAALWIPFLVLESIYSFTLSCKGCQPVLPTPSGLSALTTHAVLPFSLGIILQWEELPWPGPSLSSEVDRPQRLASGSRYSSPHPSSWLWSMWYCGRPCVTSQLSFSLSMSSYTLRQGGPSLPEPWPSCSTRANVWWQTPIWHSFQVWIYRYLILLTMTHLLLTLEWRNDKALP